MNIIFFNLHWMLFNAILAFIPVYIMFVYAATSNKYLHWLLLFLWLIFLPNAFYVVTDVIHVPPQLHRLSGDLAVQMLLLVTYVALIAWGLLCYTYTLIQVRPVIDEIVKKYNIPPISIYLFIYVLSAVALTLGRFARFNSWDLIHRPVTILTETIDIARHPGYLAWTIFFFTLLLIWHILFLRSKNA